MKYAVVQTGGKQYKVTEGGVLEVEKLAVEAGKQITLDSVLLFVEDDAVQIGKPTLTSVAVTAKVLEHTQGDKIRVAKFKAKSRYRKVHGHRQDLTKIQVEKIEAKTSKVSQEEKTKETKKTASSK